MAVTIVVVAGLFVVSGLRYVPSINYVYSPAICDQPADAFGNLDGASDGLFRDDSIVPCPSNRMSPPPGPRDGKWEWAPFWVATQ